MLQPKVADGVQFKFVSLKWEPVCHYIHVPLLFQCVVGVYQIMMFYLKVLYQYIGRKDTNKYA